MSKQAATLIVGLLALAEGRSDDRNHLREADREDVLREVDSEMLDRIAHRLYADDEEGLSAYERLLKDDKRKKMDYLNNIKPEMANPHHAERVQEELHAAAEEHHDEHHTIDDIPNHDPSQQSIRDKVLQESKRRQNDLMEARKQQEELEKAAHERQTREEAEKSLTPEEREHKRQQDRWRREFEREQHALAEEEERHRQSNDLHRY